MSGHPFTANQPHFEHWQLGSHHSISSQGGGGFPRTRYLFQPRLASLENVIIIVYMEHFLEYIIYFVPEVADVIIVHDIVFLKGKNFKNKKNTHKNR